MSTHRRTPFLSLRFLGLLASLCGASLSSAAWAVNFETPAPYAVLMDAETGAVIYEKNAEEEMHPSSLTKLMTLYVLFDQLKKGALKLDDTFIVSEAAWRMGGSKMFVKVSDRVKVEDLIQGIAVQSGNDACMVVAEGVASTEAAFAEIMNAEAKRLGMTQSHFLNASGWPQEDHLMSAMDIAVLTRHIVTDFPEYYRYFAEKEFTYNGITQHNRNRLLFRDVGADGLKTGHTEDGGYGLAASAEQNGRRLIAVVNGLPSDNARTDEAEKMLQYGFRYFSNVTLFPADKPIDSLPVWLGDVSETGLYLKKPVRAVVPREGKALVRSAAVIYDSPLRAPIPKDAQIATLKLVDSSGKASFFPLFAAEEIREASLGMRILKRMNFYVRTTLLAKKPEKDAISDRSAPSAKKPAATTSNAPNPAPLKAPVSEAPSE
ncbi:MAG: D-alanyl-D-alanine carboxypeptidase family protein [Rickettsiales bacterium]